MLGKVKKQLEHSFSKELVDALFASYQILRERYYFGDFRPTALEGGRFAEAVLRILQEKTTGSYTPLDQSIGNFVNERIKIEKSDKTKFHESLRIQIPRTIQIIYDIRNKRDIGHLSGDINANYTDATLSLTACNWVLAELFRLSGVVTDIDEAQEVVNSLIKFRIPVIQNFDGFLKILSPNLGGKEKVLLLLYYCGDNGAQKQDLRRWLKKMTDNHLNTVLSRLEHDKAYVHRDDSGRCFITDSGRRYVESKVSFAIE